MIIGIMGAMPDEVDQLCARLAAGDQRELTPGWSTTSGMLNGTPGGGVLRRYGQGKRCFHRAGSNCTKYGAEKIDILAALPAT